MQAANLARYGLVLALSLTSPLTQGFVVECARPALIGTAPLHVREGDTVAVYAQWLPPCFHAGCSPVPRNTGAVVNVSGNAVSVDLYGSDDPITLAGFRAAGTDPYQDWVGLAGSLASGTYTIVTTPHQIVSGVTTDLCAPRTSTLTVLAASAPAALDTAIEYYNAGLDHYFVTAFPGEVADLDSGVHKGWVRTSQAFQVYPRESDEGRSVCRFYGDPDAGLDSHFYTANIGECVHLIRGPSPWKFEDNAFRVELPHSLTGECRPGTRPIYRGWNTRRDSNHRLTEQKTTRDELRATGFVIEGWGPDPVAMCSPG